MIVWLCGFGGLALALFGAKHLRSTFTNPEYNGYALPRAVFAAGVLTLSAYLAAFALGVQL